MIEVICKTINNNTKLLFLLTCSLNKNSGDYVSYALYFYCQLIFCMNLINQFKFKFKHHIFDTLHASKSFYKLCKNIRIHLQFCFLRSHSHSHSHSHLISFTLCFVWHVYPFLVHLLSYSTFIKVLPVFSQTFKRACFNTFFYNNQISQVY